MSKAGKQLIEGVKEAVAIAKGEQPAASIYLNGHSYVPAEDMKRAKVLLKACLGILTKAHNSPYVIDIMEETTFYDDADCNGYCLKEDIEHFLEN